MVPHYLYAHQAFALAIHQQAPSWYGTVVTCKCTALCNNFMSWLSHVKQEPRPRWPPSFIRLAHTEICTINSYTWHVPVRCKTITSFDKCAHNVKCAQYSLFAHLQNSWQPITSWQRVFSHAELAGSVPVIACNALATSARQKPYMFNCLSSCLPSQLPSPKSALTAALRCTHPTCRREWS